MSAELSEVDVDIQYLPIKVNEKILLHRSHLRYHGYLYWQKVENKPTSLHGIQIYIRNKIDSTPLSGHIWGGGSILGVTG